MDSVLATYPYLNGLAALAERRYSSLQETIAATLQSVAMQLHLSTSLLIALDRLTPSLEISAAYDVEGATTPAVGTRLPFTLAAAEGAQLFAPLALNDITMAPDYAGFLADAAFARLGCYISVPIRLADGVVFGFLSGGAPGKRQLSAQQIELLIVLARHLAAEIERDRELAARRATEAQLERALATLRAAHGELERMQKLKSDFVTIVSHEFRTALTGIQGFSEIVRDEECSRDEVKDYAADINADARRLNRLITDMLDLDRMEAGKVKLTTGRLNLNTLIRDTVTRLSPTTTRHTMHMQLDPNLPALQGDSGKLEQALAHLLNNAIKFSPDGGQILVNTRREDGYAHVSIQDSGIGIPANEIERIFARYARVESGASRYIQGTGLGLSIVSDVIQLHGGQVWAESMLGHGATFHVTLPLTVMR